MGFNSINLNYSNVTTTIHIVLYLEERVAEINNLGEPFGPLIDIIYDLLLFTNFKVKLKWLKWDVTNQSSNGDIFAQDIVPLINKGEMDIAASYYYITLSRLMIATPLHPLINEGFSAFFRQPHFTSVTNIYFLPFQKNLFIMYFTFIVFMFLSIIMILRTLDNLSRKPKGFLSTLQNSFWWIITFLAMKSHHFVVNGAALKTFFMCGTLFFWLMYTMYSAFIISALRTNMITVRSISDLVAYGFTFQSSGVTQKAILSNGYKLPYRSKELTTLESFSLAMSGGHVHVESPGYIETFAEQLHLPVDTVCQQVSALPFNVFITSGFFVPKDSRHRKMLNLRMARLIEIGLLHRHNLNFIKARTYICPEKSNNVQEHFGITHVFSAYFILIVSFPIVVFIFVIERIYEKLA